MAKKSDKIVGASPFGANDWQVEDDLRTLQRAREIQHDPKRMKAVRTLAKAKLADMAAISTDGSTKA